MKRILCAVLSATLLLSLFGCTGNKNNNDDSYVPTNTDVAPEPEITEYYDSDIGVKFVNTNLNGLSDDDFELPIIGATGFASVKTDIFDNDKLSGTPLYTMNCGDPFKIIGENDSVWEIEYTGDTVVSGYVRNIYCYLNIPDVIPSIIIDNTNAKSSVFVSAGKSIPDITGQKLYDSLYYNGRFQKEMNVVACNYYMVKKIYAAQHAALKDGYTLVINETFRPMDVQLKVAHSLNSLYKSDNDVRKAINVAPWGIGWFIAFGMSTHQMGCAMDVSLAKVNTIEYKKCGSYKYQAVTDYTDCTMPCPIHELSAAAVSMKKPVNSYSETAWISVELADTMTDDAVRLRNYCTGAGMSPLASEWWHFNDLQVKKAVDSTAVKETFYLHGCVSSIG